ncbi:DUF6455 family protein [Oricola cellulosilytica]|uniref:DUF6455 domain-containing protein n=1 Tax=Oricola cellulosilytica TaxID=1429082 RepID=A0A4R0PE76_9HYPH|nr:DUF6455 family protein [Oricola cellulosilytica]TCD14495.1 hypothetical protein E0D97_10580 [Oricola cellulosilytica]
MFSIRNLFDHSGNQLLFQAMLDKLGLRQAILTRHNSGTVMRRAEERCAECGREESCRIWLDEMDEPIEAPRFCRNHDLFERLKHDIEAEELLQTAR